MGIELTSLSLSRYPMDGSTTQMPTDAGQLVLAKNLNTRVAD